MKLDVRTPIGAMFALYGAILLLYALIADQDAALKKTGTNANLIWGITLLVFGSVMLGLVLASRAADRAAAKKT